MRSFYLAKGSVDLFIYMRTLQKSKIFSEADKRWDPETRMILGRRRESSSLLTGREEEKWDVCRRNGWILWSCLQVVSFSLTS